MLKEADYLTGFTEELSSVASREIVDRTELRARLLLMNFGLGANMEIKRVVGGSNAAVGDGQRVTEAVLQSSGRVPDAAAGGRAWRSASSSRRRPNSASSPPRLRR